jgi:tetratricopeptide (TPR) repeat protein
VTAVGSRVICAALFLAGLFGGVARADEDPRAAAAAHYARGLELANQSQYEAALDEFNAAYATSPHFAVLYNIGQAHMALGRPLEAIAALTKYLLDGADQVPLSRREQVQAQVALLESKLAELSIATDQPGATIRVDDRDVGRTPLFQPLRLAAGTHTVTASMPDGAQVTRQVTLGEAERQRLDLVFVNRAPAPASPPVPVVTAPAPAAPVSPESGTPSIMMRRTAYLVTTVGVLVGGAAVGVYFWNRGRYDDWQSTNAALQTTPPGTAAYRSRAVANNQLADSLTSANHAILGLSIAAGALIASGVTLYLVERGHQGRLGEVAFGWGHDATGGASASVGWSAVW